MISHLAWATAVVGQIVGVALFGEGDDFGPGIMAWTFSGLVFGAVTATVASADAPRTRTGRPWDAPAVYGYVAVWVVVSLSISPTAFAYGALMLLIMGGLGLCLYLAVLVEAICFVGLRGFGSILFQGPPKGTEGSRWIVLGPFVATAGAGLWFLPIIGVLGYDSPRRRDILPLVGVLRDGVETTHPTLLLVGQVGTFWVLGLIALGTVLSVATSRLRL
ncbi:hypothetical protein [Aeromicrobium fastidiosum]|uniref:Uncharacterized protein n=1 Tax=Aeromicrobium fastidiosum TaxID=52699 RepID=A0A641AGQ1_9ACTN|nr:hypothetical protein [Aeromicrobium fastidiosum]KAA1372443.1 hypothetical protein ESP62_018745 [Aeromicrobium fastidiosum]MBP2391483.1 hypothetical protein [Aeromicrobium fastidiosum]